MAATTSTSSKKRKRPVVDTDNDPTKVSFRLSTHPASQPGPVLVSFPALTPPSSTPFTCYARKKAKAGHTKDGIPGSIEEDWAEQDVFIAGEAPSVEFVSNYEETRRASDSGCRYLVAVYNRRTQIATLRPAPLHILTSTVKALKSIPPAPLPTLQPYSEARAALGETFGTKKAQAAIKARERNKVDVSAMEGVAEHLTDRIGKSTGGLMTKEGVTTHANMHRLVPPFDETATDPENIYPLHGIIPETEWKTLSFSPFAATKNDRDRVALLPYTRSNWVNQHLAQELKNDNPSKRNVKILFYVATLLAFRRAINFKDFNKDKLSENLSKVPNVILEGLLARFTETPRGSSQPQSTSATQTRLLTYLFALLLRVDNYATDTLLVAHDLSMEVAKVNQMFKTLGCKIEFLKERERSRLGLPDSAGDTKRATLSAPVKFPVVKGKRGKRN